MIVVDLRERLKAQNLRPEVILFGARARGDDVADLDLCLVLPEVAAEMIEQIHAECWNVGFDHGVTLCPLVVSRAELDHPTALMRQIRAAGVAL